MKLKPFLVVLVFSLAFLYACGSSPTPESIPTLESTGTPEPTRTTEPTAIPTITATPQPRLVTKDDLFANCEEFAKQNNPVVINGKVFLPEFIIYGYTGMKGMNLSESIAKETNPLTIFIQIGDGPNTMNPLPEFFSERDLLIRDATNRAVHHGYTVMVTGHPKFNKDKPDRMCEIWVDTIESVMPEEALIPLPVEIGYLLEEHSVGHGLQTRTTSNCALLAEEKRFITVNGSIDYSDAGSVCDMGICRLRIKDQTGMMTASIVDSEKPNSMLITPGLPAPDGWKLYDKTGAEVDPAAISLTGILYAEPESCRLSVYTIQSQ